MQREYTPALRDPAFFIRKFQLEVVEGPERGTRVDSLADELTIGTSLGNDLVLTDEAVSRHHCSLRASDRGLELRDLGSKNGTFVGSCEVERGLIRSEARLQLGKTIIAVRILNDEVVQPIAASTGLGDLIGASTAMRRIYPLIEQYATSTATVLIYGETGTGKELVAEAIHLASDRRDAPFVVVDCAALTGELAESELFGHVRGAFTGASTDRVGVFEAAAGGTIFLDEVSELPDAVQSKLLRVLENRTVRRLGSNDRVPVDVRVIAASHRDLRALVNTKRLRQDLYYRLNVLRISIPPLREREGDIALLARSFWNELHPGTEPPPAVIDQLAERSWPGNVRELRNAVERAALVGLEPGAGADSEPTYQQAKEVWERGWLAQLLRRHDGNLSRTARAARMGRSHLRELVRRYQLGAVLAS
jgi:DNA-binding NtrC family response regulator